MAKVVWREEKLRQLKVSAEELQSIRLQGQSYNTETGLHFNRFRYFDPDLSMFTTRDPIGLMGGDNVFAYAPNPTGWADLLGLANRPNNVKYKTFTEHTVPLNNCYFSDSVQFRQANKSFKK